MVSKTRLHPRDYTFMPFGYGWWPTELMAVCTIAIIVLIVTTVILGIYCIDTETDQETGKDCGTQGRMQYKTMQYDIEDFFALKI